MSKVAVVTDSTAEIPSDLAEALDLRVVPMSVTFGDDSFISRLTITTEDFYARLAASSALPTTSQPSPAWFEEAYADAADAGCDGVVSVHLSSALSGTVDVARHVAESAQLPVEVVDSRQVSGSLALTVLAAQRRSSTGASMDEVTEAARAAARDARIYFTVDTLDYLRKGGRLTGTQTLVGNVLRVKPLLTIADGEVDLLERTRTWTRAMQRLCDLVADNVRDRACDVVVTHALAPDRAKELWRLLDERVDVHERLDTVVGPVVGTHTGPGAIAVAVLAHDAD